MTRYRVSYTMINPRNNNSSLCSRQVNAESDAMAVEVAKGQHFSSNSTHRKEGWEFRLVKVEKW